MLQFFRKIRRRLIGEGKLKRYVLYALGEILLIMVGILLAFQINNWNENRKEKDLENNLFRELKIGLTRDINDIEFNYGFHQKSMQSQDIIINWLESDKPYHDSLCRHFSIALSYTGFVKNTGPYETIKSLGTQALTNLELRDDITELYEIFYKSYTVSENDYFDRITNSIKNLNGQLFNVSEIYVVKDQGQFYPDPGCMTPVDEKNIKTNNEYKHFIKSLKSANDFFMKYNMLNTKNKASKIVKGIEAYLGDQ